MSTPALGLNRFDWRSPDTFATDVARAEALGWGWALIPASSMLIQDPYVNLAFAAQKTSNIGLGVLLDNPIVRHPAVLASAMATIEITDTTSQTMTQNPLMNASPFKPTICSVERLVNSSEPAMSGKVSDRPARK